MTHSSPVTDEIVERAWAAIVGDDIAARCYNVSIIRRDLRTALEAVFPDAAATPTDRCAKCGCETQGEAALVGDQTWCHPCADAALAPKQDK
jgi:hypothetical protein